MTELKAETTCHVFVGSSAESLDLAYALQENLNYDAELTVWSQGIFELSKSSLSSLEDSLDRFDFAVFIFSPDDITKIREADYKVARDNVVFELGMFIGRLGSERCYIVAPHDVLDMHLPSDLLGITPATYKSHVVFQNDQARLGPAANRIRQCIKKLGRFAKEANSLASSVPVADVPQPTTNLRPKLSPTGAELPPVLDIDWADINTMRKLRKGLSLPIALKLLDISSTATLSDPDAEVSFEEVYKKAGFTDSARARSSLGAFTKVIKREFGVATWPVKHRFGPRGEASYSMLPEVANAWRESSTKEHGGTKTTDRSAHFLEDFTGGNVSIANWQRISVPDGVIASTDGLRLIGIGDRFPTVRSRGPVFPRRSNWSSSITFRYQALAPCGTSIKIMAESREILVIHQDNTNGRYIDLLGKRIFQGEANTEVIELLLKFHDYKFFISTNGVPLGEAAASVRPTHFEFGNNELGAQRLWSNLLIYKVEVTISK